MVCHPQSGASAAFFETGFHVRISAMQSSRNKNASAVSDDEGSHQVEAKMRVWSQLHRIFSVFLTNSGLIQDQYTFWGTGLESVTLKLSFLCNHHTVIFPDTQYLSFR